MNEKSNSDRIHRSMQLVGVGSRQMPDGPVIIVSYRYLEKHGIDVHRTTLNRWEKLGLFPVRVRCSSNKIGWVQSEIDEYLRRLAARRAGGQ